MLIHILTIYTPTLGDAQQVFVNVLAFLWSIVALIFLVQVFRTGFEYMFAVGDSKKLQVYKERFPQLIQGFVFTMIAWILCSGVISLIGIKDPNQCFNAGLAEITFQFVFVTRC